jgi:hypothetical protein
VLRTALSLSLSLIFGVAVLSAGCHTTGFERAEQTTVSMRALDVELDRLSEQVSATNGSLGELVSETDTDVKSLYQSLVQGLDRLEAHSSSVKSLASRLRSRGDAYFAAWDEKLETQTDPDLRSLSTTRRADSHAAFEDVLSAVGDIHTHLGPYRADLGEIRTFLDTNLSRSGIKAIAGKIEKVREGAAPVQTQISTASKALDAWTEEWAPPSVSTDAETDLDEEEVEEEE